MHCKFEATIKIDCVTAVIDLAKAGKVGNGELATAVEHACCFGGCAAALYKTTIDPSVDPVEPPLFGAVQTGESVEEICDILEGLCANVSQKSAEGVEAIDWNSVFAIVTMVWELIRAWRKS